MRSVQFDLTAHAAATGLRWRRADTSSDVLQPSSGPVQHDGPTSVLVSDLVLDSAVTLEIVAGDDVVLSFTLRHH
jgi:hypothetical protein